MTASGQGARGNAKGRPVCDGSGSLVAKFVNESRFRAGYLRLSYPIERRAIDRAPCRLLHRLGLVSRGRNRVAGFKGCSMSTETAAASPPREPERDALRAEAIIAAVLTLAMVGTRGEKDAGHVVKEYRKILHELRAGVPLW
jgi:hypothetical protein